MLHLVDEVPRNSKVQTVTWIPSRFFEVNFDFAERSCKVCFLVCVSCAKPR